MRFPYLPVGARDFAPIITLGLRGRSGWVEMEAYVDSGATVSIFHANRAQILGVSHRAGRPLHLTVGDGGLLEVFLLRIPVRVAGEQFMADLGFSEQLGVGFNLLGRRSFFDRFRVCFDDRRRFLELSPR